MSSKTSHPKSISLRYAVVLVMMAVSQFSYADDEPANNEQNGAENITIGSNIEGTLRLDPLDFFDWYSFNLDTDGSVQINFSTSPFNNVMYATIRGNNHYISQGGGSINLGRMAAGTHYMRLNANQGMVSYSFSVVASDLEIPIDVEENGNFSSAIDIPPLSFVNGHINYIYPFVNPPALSDGNDYYKLKNNVAGLYNFELIYSSTAFETELITPRICLRDSIDPFLFPICSVENPGVPYISLENVFLDSATYYVQIIGEGAGAGYSLVQNQNLMRLDFYNFVDGRRTHLGNSEGQYREPVKISADGSSVTELRFFCEGCLSSDLEFRIVDKFANETSPSLIGSFSDPSSFGLNNPVDTLVQVLNHPTYANQPSPFRTLSLQVWRISDNRLIFENEMEVYRPPLLLVHGLGGSKNTFRKFEEYLILSDLYPSQFSNIELRFLSPLVRKIDYSSTSFARFNLNRKKVPSDIKTLLNFVVINENISASKVDIVGHSMGGLLARKYIQSLNLFQDQDIAFRNDVNKLITQNTPHFGTPAANWILEDSKGQFLLFLLRAANGLPNPEIYPESGAFRDLKVADLNSTFPNSSYELSLLNIPQSASNIVPSAVIGSNGENDSELGVFHGFVAQCMTDDGVFMGDISDLVVPKSSQLSSLPDMHWVEERWHMGISSTIEMMELTSDLLSQDPLSSSFVQDGFPPGLLFYESQGIISDDLDKNNFTDSLNIISPVNFAQFEPGELLQVDLEVPFSHTHLKLLATHNQEVFEVIDTLNVSSLFIQIPDSAFGELEFLALSGDSINTNSICSTRIDVVPIAGVDSISVFLPYDTLILGQYFSLEVLAHADTLTYPITRFVQFESDTLNLTYTLNNEFQAIDAGMSNIYASYSGLTDSVAAFVDGSGEYLSANMDWSNRVICLGGMMNFMSISRGLPLSYEWIFEGGSPSQSTQPDTEVNYFSSGQYDVTLIVHSEMVSDTLHMPDLVSVMPSQESAISVIQCDPYMSPSGLYQYEESGTYSDTLLSTFGCDSIIQIELEILTDSVYFNDQGCSEFTWSVNNQTYTQSGIYNDTLLNSHGCDSIIYLDLTIENFSPTISQEEQSLIASKGTEFQWLKCVGQEFELLEDETSQSFLPISSGEYAVIVSNGNCIDTTACFTFLIDGILENGFGDDFRFYPNPTNGPVKIELGKEFEVVDLSIYNARGSLMEIKRFQNTSQFEFEIHQSSGIYIIEIQSETGDSAKLKIIRE